jgi:hypothetical protein
MLPQHKYTTETVKDGRTANFGLGPTGQKREEEPKMMSTEEAYKNRQPASVEGK